LAGFERARFSFCSRNKTHKTTGRPKINTTGTISRRDVNLVGGGRGDRCVRSSANSSSAADCRRRDRAGGCTPLGRNSVQLVRRHWLMGVRVVTSGRRQLGVVAGVRVGFSVAVSCGFSAPLEVIFFSVTKLNFSTRKAMTIKMTIKRIAGSLQLARRAHLAFHSQRARCCGHTQCSRPGGSPRALLEAPSHDDTNYGDSDSLIARCPLKEL
jgi:hypothetical protein